PGGPIADVRRQAALVAGFGLAVPLAAGAVGLGLLSGSRRRGLNFFASTWPRALLATNGIRFTVVGAQNLTARRPAVFLYNHRNRVDPFIAAALLHDNWIKIAKKELACDPIIGTLLKLNDGVFVDRDDTAAAVETLRQVEQRAKDGLSILIAPEGTGGGHHRGGAVQEGRVPHRHGRGRPDRADRDPQRADHRRADSMEINPGTV
ncbi:Acyltransferase, partial [Mycobacterium parascrofulaceum ATCC BAA-614]